MALPLSPIEDGMGGEQFRHAVLAIARLSGAHFHRLEAGFALRRAGDQCRDLRLFGAVRQRGKFSSRQIVRHAKEFGQRRIGVADDAIAVGKGHTHGRVAKQIAQILRRGLHNDGRWRRLRFRRDFGGFLRFWRGIQRTAQYRLRRRAGRQPRGEPPGALLVRQRTDSGDDFQAGQNDETFLARASLGGVARQAIEHRGTDFARDRQFGRRRRIAFAHTRHAAIDGIAVEHRAVFTGDGPGDIGSNT